MGKLYGYIVSVKELLANADAYIKINVDHTPHIVHELKNNRNFIIPDFQREIRWTPENVAELIEDVSKKEKHLGNIILTQQANNYEIIDGQQRITTILMILAFIRQKYGTQIDVISACDLCIESFNMFQTLLNSYFSTETMVNQAVIDSDKLQQRGKYLIMWDAICNSSILATKQSAQDFLANLINCTVNIVLNRTNDASVGIGYFIDVNLKGLQLDDEDVFKGYLFKNDQGENIRSKWYLFKQKNVAIQNSNIGYPLLKLIEHFLYCDLYDNPKFEGLIFKENLRIAAGFSTHEPNPESFRVGTHIVEVINDKSYFVGAFERLNRVIDVMLQFTSSEGLTDGIKTLLSVTDGERVDNDEMVVIHNLISKILKDNNILPKALVIKYILKVILSNRNRTKVEIRKIYGVYLLSILFVVFENKKSKDVFASVLKSRNNTWYDEVIAKVRGQFDNSRPTQARLVAAVGHVQNEDAEDYKFRCKSLATIFNFFRIVNNEVTCRPIPEVKAFLTNSMEFSVEHFIISESDTIKALKPNGLVIDYQLLTPVKKFRLGFFNFIFIPQRINKDVLLNYWLPEKLNKLVGIEIKCDYSRMIIDKVASLSQEMKNAIPTNDVNQLDTFFSRRFNELYIEYARAVLSAVFERLTDETP